MGSVISAINDDMDEYEHLCEKYGEKVQYWTGGPHCYGEHALGLKKRLREEQRIEHERRTHSSRKSKG